MNLKSVENNLDEQRHLLGDLQHLLEKQIDLAHQGDISAVEMASMQAGAMAKKIAQTKILEQAAFKDQRERLQSLYADLCLVLTTEKANIADRLNHIRKGKKTIATYHDNIQ